MATPHNRSNSAERSIQADLPTKVAASDGEGVTFDFDAAPRQRHAIRTTINTEHGPVRAFVADWAFWAGDAA